MFSMSFILHSNNKELSDEVNLLLIYFLLKRNDALCCYFVRNINWIITIIECSFIYCVQLVYLIFYGYVFLKLFLDTSFFFFYSNWWFILKRLIFILKKIFGFKAFMRSIVVHNSYINKILVFFNSFNTLFHWNKRML